MRWIGSPVRAMLSARAGARAHPPTHTHPHSYTHSPTQPPPHTHTNTHTHTRTHARSHTNIKARRFGHHHISNTYYLLYIGSSKLVMRTPVTLVLASPKSTTHHALFPRSVWKCVALSPSFPREAISIVPYSELMNAGLPSAMFTSVVTATHQRDDVTRSRLQITSINRVAIEQSINYAVREKIINSVAIERSINGVTRE